MAYLAHSPQKVSEAGRGLRRRSVGCAAFFETPRCRFCHICSCAVSTYFAKRGL